MTFTSLTFAQSFDREIINVLGLANKQNLNAPDYTCNQEMIKADALTDKDYNNCAIALCGAPDKNKAAYVNDENILNLIPEETKDAIKKLDKEFNQMYSQGLQISKMRLGFFIKTFSEENLANLNSNSFRREDASAFQSDLFSKYIKYELDKSKTYPDKHSYRLVNIPKDASPNLILALEDYKKILTQTANNSWDGDSILIYSPDELANILLEKTQHIESTLKTSNGIVDANIFSELKNKIEQFKNNIDKKLPLNAAGNARILFAQLEKLSPEKYNMSDCETQNCYNYFIQYIREKNPSKYAKIILEKMNDPEEKRFAINQCKATLMYDSINKLNNSDKSKNIFEDAKNKVKDNFLNKLSEHSRATLSDYLDNKLTIAEEKSREVDISKHIRSSLTKVSRFSDMSGVVLSDQVALSLKDDISSINALTFGDTICSNTTRKILQEQFVPMDKDQHLIKISHYSCDHQVFGKQILAHELAHAISYEFQKNNLSESSTKLYKELRECVSSIHKNDTNHNGQYAFSDKENSYTEEDTADVIAFTSYSNEKELFMCNILRPSLDLRSYIDLAPKSGPDDDVHSSPFLRVLHEATYRNTPLPISCKKILDNDTSIELKKCL